MCPGSMEDVSDVTALSHIEVTQHVSFVHAIVECLSGVKVLESS